MSRSYKKSPVSTLAKDSFMKNYANRRIRRMAVDEEIKEGSSYKKISCSYDICDFVNYMTQNENKEFHHMLNIRYPFLAESEEEIWNSYQKHHVRK